MVPDEPLFLHFAIGKTMRRVLLSGVAAVVLCTALAGCLSDVDRAMAYCQENYSGYTQSECERQFRHRYSGIGHTKASER